jgi:hypothetical protein
MSEIVMVIYIGSMAFCAVALGLTILIVGIKTLKDKDNE